MKKGGGNKKPLQLHQLQGTARASRQGGGGPRPAGPPPTCPSWLAPEAKRMWERLAPELKRLGLLTRLDRAAFSAYCQAYARWRAAEEAIGRDGEVIPGHRGVLRKSPWVTISRQAQETMRQLAAEFGLSPQSRSRLRVTPPEEPDPMGDFLKGGPSA